MADTFANPSVIGQAIHLARTRKRLTQSELAEQCGVSRYLIGRIERGHPKAEIGLILKVADLLDLRVDISPRPTYPDPESYIRAILDGPS